LVVSFWSRPPAWGMKPFQAEFDFPMAGEYGASFYSPPYEQSDMSRARDLTITKHENPATTDSKSDNVSKRGHPCLFLSVPNEPTDESDVIQSCRMTHCRISAPTCPSTIPESPAEVTVADSESSPILSAAAGLRGRPSESPPPSSRKRQREEVEYGSGGEAKGDNQRKKRRVPETHDDTRGRNV
jgi:hypothetical protein